VSFRTRLSLTRLEERENPSVPGPVDPSGGTSDPDPVGPAQTDVPPATLPPADPYGSFSGSSISL
jgi:hypothetical protein